jgi:hypothetical protein
MSKQSLLRNALLASALLAAGFMTTTASAREATVTLKDGTKMTGDVIQEDAQSLTLMIAGIRTPITRERIQDVAYVQTISEQYKERRARIADDNQDERFKLIRWLIDAKAWEQAQSELNDYNKKFPDEGDRVRLLQRIIDSRKKVTDEPAPLPEEKTPAPAASQKPVKVEKDKGEALEMLARRLSEDQVNLIRIYEIDPDSKPAVIMKPDVIDDLFRNYATEPAVPKGKEAQDRFRGLPGYEKLKVFFAAKARDLYPRIKVNADPDVIKVYREKVQTIYVLNYCGTNECHGGLVGGRAPGDFFIFNKEPANVDQTVYTNFYILHQYEKGRGYMLNFEKPDESYLLQFGLPVAQAALPHKAVKGWKPSFFNPNDARFQMISKWIGSFPPSRADYGITWTSPGVGGPAPATTQAVEPMAPSAPVAEPPKGPQTPPPANPTAAPHTSGPERTRPIVPKP